MNQRNLLIAVGMVCAISLGAIASANANTTQEFVRNATIANSFEIESSKLALDRAKTSEVKDFAQKMITDHTQTGEKMKATLKVAHENVIQPKDLDDKHQKLLDDLRVVDDGEFDKEYITIQTNAHKEAVDLFTDYSKNGSDTDLRNFAASTLPALEGHLEHVKQLKATE